MNILPSGSLDIKKKKYSLYLKSTNKLFTIDTEYQFDEDNDIAKLKLSIDGEDIEITDCCTEGVFSKLSEKLKGKYEIYSCYTCRYGNFCIFGDQDNEIFCINDFEPKSKTDLIPVMTDKKEIEKRVRTLFHVCDSHMICCDDYYTYKQEFVESI